MWVQELRLYTDHGRCCRLLCIMELFSWHAMVLNSCMCVQELRLYTDYGRCCRPLFIVKDQKLLIKKGDIIKLQHPDEVKYGWQDMVYNGYIE